MPREDRDGRSESDSRVVVPKRSGSGAPDSWLEIHSRWVAHRAPPSLLISSEHQVLLLSEGAGRFLQLADGAPTRHVLGLIHPLLRRGLEAALGAVAETKHEATVPNVPWPVGDGGVNVTIRVTPGDDFAPELLLVSFEERAATLSALTTNRDLMVELLERELAGARALLARAIEGHQSSMHELSYSNTELGAMNEELRAAGEELEQSRHQLESTNVELSTVNQELRVSLEVQRRAKSDLENLMAAARVPILFVDRELRIMRFTPAASDLFQIIAEDVGRPLAQLQHVLRYEGLLDDARRALEELETIEREVRDGKERCFLARVLPYRTSEGSIAGVVLTFLDITEKQQAQDLVTRVNEHLEAGVRARTTELDRLNDALRYEITEQQRHARARMELQKQLVMAQEEERGRISRELHDEVGQQLTALLLGLKQLESSCEQAPETLQKLDGLRQIAQQIGREIHELALALRPTALDDLGLLGALTNYLEDWSASTGIALDLHTSGLDGQRLPSHVETTVYRVAQEALNNVVKHAEARNVSITLEWRQGELLVVIEDDGAGFEAGVPSQAAGHQRLGLSGMRERVALVDGALTVESRPGSGTTVILRVPAERLRPD